MKKSPIDPSDFREWVQTADLEDLIALLEDIEDIVLDLEADDFFGTEGLNKRFA